MKLHLTLALVAMVICSLHVQQSDAFLGKAFRRLGSRIRDAFRRPNWRALGCVACPRVCSTVTQGLGTPACHVACASACRRGKRDTWSWGNWFRDGHVTPLANSWRSHDLDEDDFLDRRELATSTGDNSTSPGLIQAFRLADTNGDDLLSKEEFYQGPFVFEMDMDEEDYTECLAVFSRYGERDSTTSTTQTPPTSQPANALSEVF